MSKDKPLENGIATIPQTPKEAKMDDVITTAITEAIENLEAVEDLVPSGDFYDEFLATIHRLEDLKEQAEA